METYFNTMFEVVTHERSLVLLLSLVEPSIFKQAKFRDHEIDIFKDIALQKLHRQRNLNEIIALHLLEKQFSDQKKMAFPNLNNEAELLKTRFKDDQLKELQYKTEKQDHENLLKTLKIDNEYYKKKYKSLNKENIVDYH